jgi:hypothetical protein
MMAGGMKLLLLLALLFHDDYETLLERLRNDNRGEYEKVITLERETALRFLRERYGTGGGKAPEEKLPITSAPAVAPALTEAFERLETITAGDCAIDLCRREDGAFGLGEIRQGGRLLRRADFLATWKVQGRFLSLDRRDGPVVHLREPRATLTFSPERRECAGTVFSGFSMELRAEASDIVETASWEPGGTTRGLAYFDGYRGWHAPPGWLGADAVAGTNPKLAPSLLEGTGFQVLHGPDGVLLVFHTAPGDRLVNASRGEALRFETTFDGPQAVKRHVLTATGGNRIDLWTRAFEVAHAELRKAFGLVEPANEVLCLWPPFGRKGFRETAEDLAAATAREGFTGVVIDVVWDNLEFHGGAKNMNVWTLDVCDGYGGPRGLRSLVEACRRENLIVIPWAPAGHLVNTSPVWKDHPDWLLGRDTPSKPKGGPGPVFGSLASGFHDYFRGRLLEAVRTHGFDGYWMDTHLSFAQQTRAPGHAAKLAAIYADLARAGATRMIVEGDASVFGSHGIAVGDDWLEGGKKMPDPDLYYRATLSGGSMDPSFWRASFRRWVAAGAPWSVPWELLTSPKVSGGDAEEARREVRQVIEDYRSVKDRMVHRFVHADGSGYTWTNDRDRARVVWLLEDAMLPDGRARKAGKVYVIEKD